MSHQEIVKATTSFENTFKYLQDNSVIFLNFDCEICHDKMSLTKSKSLNIKMLWKCFKKKCQTTKSITFGSFFFLKKVPFTQNPWIIFYYFNNINIEKVSAMLKIERHSIGRYFDHIENAIIYSMQENFNTYKIGGNFLEVQLDETYYSNNLKIFGGVCKNTKEFFIEIVENCSEKTLHEVIERRVEANSIIVTDGHKSYTNLKIKLPEICKERH